MVNDKPLFTEDEHWNDIAMQIDAEVRKVTWPIVKKFVAAGYNVREICHILLHNAAALECEFILDAQYRSHKEKKACLQKNES